MKRREFVRSAGLASLAFPLARCGLGVRRSVRRPNILFIMSDDHASQAVGCYGGRLNRTPGIDRIAREGVRFDNCFCTNGICAPSRAVILTGKHSHLNGVRDNAVAFDGSQSTFPKLLRAAGYETALLGKWHLKSDPTGFDYWNILPGQGDYYNPDLIEMGAKKRVAGYVTDILTDIAVDFLEARRTESQPFLLMLQHKAPHRNWQPAARHMAMYDTTEFPEPPTLFDDYETRSRAAFEQEMTIREHMTLDSDLKLGPPPERLDETQRAAWEKAFGPKRDAFHKAAFSGQALVRWKFRRYLQDYLGCIAAVDESVGRVLDVLDRTGLAENTLVVYTSDQGFFLGEHGWFDKRFMYEEALRMPLVMRFPGRLKPGSANGDMVSNLDFAPTFLDVAGQGKPAPMQGRSFLPLLLGRRIAGWPESVYFHYYEFPAVHMVKRHYGVRTKQHKLIHFYHDIDAWELYDLERDPNELRNVYGDPAYATVRRRLEAELSRLQGFYRDSEALGLRFVDIDKNK
ncbi:MAG: sulfatase [Candidatus Aminicenantes bacterium]|nr:sulfatase [Candidatus Aminicenantes bacterium]